MIDAQDNILEVLQYPHEILRKVSAPVSDQEFGTLELMEFSQAMIATMNKQGGVGLAAPQVGRSLRMFVMLNSDFLTSTIYINPRIVSKSLETVASVEGCLSFKGYTTMMITHAKEVTMHAYDVNGQPFERILTGLMAQCAQHEYRHLDGELIIDHESNKKV